MDPAIVYSSYLSYLISNADDSTLETGLSWTATETAAELSPHVLLLLVSAFKQLVQVVLVPWSWHSALTIVLVRSVSSSTNFPIVVFVVIFIRRQRSHRGKLFVNSLLSKFFVNYYYVHWWRVKLRRALVAMAADSKGPARSWQTDGYCHAAPRHMA